MSDQLTPTAPPVKPRRGCFFYGCMTGIILLVIVVVAAIAGFYALKKKVDMFVTQYTDTQPVTLPVTHLSPDDLDKLKQRFNAFELAVQNHKPTEPLVLTSDEVNALIANDKSGGNAFKGKLYITLDGDKVRGELSLPLDDFGRTLTMLKGRYLNGNGTFNVNLRDGMLFVTPDTVTVKGKSLPDKYMDIIRTMNFAASLTNNPDAASVLSQLQEIDIKDSKLTVVPKNLAGGAAEASPK